MRFRIALLLATGLALGLGTPSHSQQQDPPVVQVAEPVVRSIRDFDLYTGQFQAVQTVQVQSRVSGYLQSIAFREGALVKKGDLLFEIDPRSFQAEVAQREAELQVAGAAQRLAEVNNARAAELLQRRVGSQADADTRQAELAQAVANVALAEARLGAAQINLDFTKVYAPIDGRISSADIDIGNLVTPERILTRIVSLDPIEFVFDVSEEAFIRYSRLSRSGQRASSRENANQVAVRLSDESTWERRGTMNFVDNVLDPNSGTMQGRALFENSDYFLTPGIYGRLQLPASDPYEAILIPDAAVVQDQATKIVYVVGDGNIVEARPVMTGPMHLNMRVIREGLEAGDVVIVRGLQRVRPGAPVTPEETTLTVERPS